MEKLLFIAEKPSLMRDCQAVYRKNFKSIPYDIDFVALSGHVCGFENPKSYSDWDKKWAEIKLPMIPDTWKIGINPDKKKLYSDITNQIKSKHYDGFICATDSDREGNLIYYLIAEKSGIRTKKTYRFWVHDLTEKGIMDAFNSMTDMSKDAKQINLTNASILRSKFDWLIGMNFTVSATVHTNTLMKIGRVKTPTLKIVYDNCNAIDNFKPTTTYEIESIYKEGFSGFHVDKRYKTKEEAQKIIDTLGLNASVESIEKKTVSTSAPQLYKLSDLQIDASKAFGYTPDKTLAITQCLYERHKLVSYPRCDCRYISVALSKDFDKLLKAVEPVSDKAKGISKMTMDSIAKNKKYVNDAEVNKSSHTALMPTGKIPDMSKLDMEEQNILTLIYKRFLAIFLPPLVEEKCVVMTKNLGNSMMFKSNGKIVKDPGYTVLYSMKLEDSILPPLTKSQKLDVKEFKINDKTTTPPARLTEGTLIKEMENISKYIDDKELKSVMSEAEGIGTPATRGSIITSLVKDGYMDSKKTKKAAALYITDKGRKYIENLLSFSIVSPELTAEWEKKLREIEIGEFEADKFESQMFKFVNDISSELQSAEMTKNTSGFKAPTGTVVAKCPKCGKNIVETPKTFSCEDPDCGCVIFKNDKYFASLGQKMTKTNAVALFKKGEVILKGIKSKKTGNTYDAKIKVKFGEKYPQYSMEFIDGKSNSKTDKSAAAKKLYKKK